MIDYKNNISIQNTIDNFAIKYLPNEVDIVTITMSCEIEDIQYNYENISLYSKFEIKDGKQFFNQLTILVNVPSKKNKPITIKLCCNGSLQLTGCQNMEQALEAINSIFEEFKEPIYVIDYKSKKMIEKSFVKDTSKLCFENINKFKVCMINSGFQNDYNINKKKLYELFQKIDVNCHLNEKHAALNIKYKADNKLISILVFENNNNNEIGSKIIITGSYNCKQIYLSYMFIKTYLNTYKKHIENINLINIIQ